MERLLFSRDEFILACGRDTMRKTLLQLQQAWIESDAYKRLIAAIDLGCRRCGGSCPYSRGESTDPADLPDHCRIRALIQARWRIDGDRGEQVARDETSTQADGAVRSGQEVRPAQYTGEGSN